jgi:signal transduction histidine kinase
MRDSLLKAEVPIAATAGGMTVRGQSANNTQFAEEKRLLEMIASGYTLADVLGALCCFVEAVVGDCRCGVYLMDWSERRLRAFAAPSLPASFNEGVCGLPLSYESWPCARAACLRTSVIAVNVESDPLWVGSEFRPLALAHLLKSCWSIPIFALDGHVLGIVAILHGNPARPTSLQEALTAKVTHIASIAIERAQSEAALKRSEAFLAEAQRLSSTGSFSWRVATDEITWSEQLYRIFECDKSARLTPALIDARVHPEDLPAVRKIMEGARNDGRDIECEHRLLMSDRSIKFVHMVARATRDPDGHLEYIGAVQDVTQRRLSEDALTEVRSQLAHATRVMSLGALTASIAHEVNQPLSGIVTNASTCLRMLAADPPDIVGARDTARRTLRDGNRASDVVSRLRALFGKERIKTGRLDLNDATREVIALSLSELQRNRVVLRTELGEDLPPVIGDRVQLQQVILNLLRNASDAMSGIDNRERRLVISTRRDERHQVRLSVTDVGVGLKFPIAEKLFEPFCSTKSTGMGVGLFVSRSIIENHRGCLQVVPNDGPGVTFSFTIPRIRRPFPALPRSYRNVSRPAAAANSGAIVE